MVDKDAKGAAKRFMVKLQQNGFAIARSKNTEKNYSTIKQERDSRAVEDFVETDIFRDILKLR
jgi:hypothetical protein